jgi:hypothetical protein
MDWKCDLRGKVSALKAQSPEFKPQSHQMEKKTQENKTWICLFLFSL